MCENHNASSKAAGSSNHIATGKKKEWKNLMDTLGGTLFDAMMSQASRLIRGPFVWEIIMWLLVQGGPVPVINGGISL